MKVEVETEVEVMVEVETEVEVETQVRVEMRCGGGGGGGEKKKHLNEAREGGGISPHFDASLWSYNTTRTHPPSTLAGRECRRTRLSPVSTTFSSTFAWFPPTRAPPE